MSMPVRAGQGPSGPSGPVRPDGWPARFKWGAWAPLRSKRPAPPDRDRCHRINDGGGPAGGAGTAAQCHMAVPHAGHAAWINQKLTSPSPGRAASGAGRTSRAWAEAAGRSIRREGPEAARRTIPGFPDTGRSRSRHGMDPSSLAEGEEGAAAAHNTRGRAPERTGKGHSSPCWSRSPGGHPPTVPEPRSEWPGPRRP